MITSSRQPQPRLAAVYLLMPTTQNVDLVLRDYNPSPTPAQSKSSKKGAPPPTQEPPKYAAAYVNFMEGAFRSLLLGGHGTDEGMAGINDALVGKLTDGLPENYLQGLKELYINFHGTVEPALLPGPHRYSRHCQHSSRTSGLFPPHPAHLPFALRSARTAARSSARTVGGRDRLDGALSKSQFAYLTMPD